MHRIMWRRAAVVALLAAALLGMSAAKLQCNSEAGTPQKNPAVSHAARPSYEELVVRVRITWRYNRFTGPRTIEITTTKPGAAGPGPTVPLTANKDDYFDQLFSMAPGQRISVTADQTRAGFLQCQITVYGDVTHELSHAERSDGGSVHCEWTRPVQGLG